MDYVGGSCFRRAIFILILLSFAFCRSEDAIDCSNTCTVDGDDLQCWQGTENFLLNQLIETVNNLTRVEVMIDKWRSKHGKTEAIDETVAELVQRVERMKMNQGPLNASDVDNIVNYTLTQILNWAAWKLGQPDDETYSVHCPIPYDYVNTLWIYMFSCACIVMVLMLIYVIIHIHKLRGGVKKQKRLI